MCWQTVEQQFSPALAIASAVSGNVITDDKMHTNDITNRLKFFQDEVLKCFSFLIDYGYSLAEIKTGREENFLNYFCKILFVNGDTEININYSTDILNGIKTAFPNEKELPVTDNQIYCSISDLNALMSISRFAETTQPELSSDNFKIGLNFENINYEISRVINNYIDFFQTHLVEILKKEKIYECYIDRFDDLIFEEKHYR